MFKQFQQLTLRVVDLVNSPRKTQRIMRDVAVSRVVLRDFYEALKLMDNKGFLAGGLSEASLRGSGGKFLITPADIPIGILKEKEMLAIAIVGKEERLPGLPKHAAWHREVYEKTKANAVMLCQPVHACLLAGRGKLPKKGFLTDADAVLEESQFMPAGEFKLEENMPDDFLLLIEGVGVLAWGQSLNTLLARVEVFEKLCEIQIRSDR